MANLSPYLGNVISHDPLPLVRLGLVAAASAIEKGDIVEYTGNSNTEWVVIDSDFAGDANVAVMNEEVRTDDALGYYELIVPRPGDIFEFTLVTAGNPLLGAGLYWVSDGDGLAESGSNILCRVADDAHYPKQNHVAINGAGAPDEGVTIPNTANGKVIVAFLPAVSYYEAIFGPLA